MFSSSSENTADSTYWNYNKNPHAGIFVIRQFNLTNNVTEQVTGGPGGVRKISSRVPPIGC